MKKQIIFLIFILISCGFCENNTSSLSLEDALLLAYKNNKDILIQESETKAAKAKIMGAKSEFLPKLNLAGGYIHNSAVVDLEGVPIKLPKDPGVFFGYDNEGMLGITIDQPIYTGGRNTAELRQSLLNLRVQEESLRLKKIAIEFETKRLYYGLLLAYETERITKKLFVQTNAHYEDVEKNYKEGTSSRFDVLQSKVQVSKIIPQLVKAKNSSKLILAELKKLLGIDLEEKMELSGSLEFSFIGIKEERFLKQAYRNRPDLIMKDMGIDISKQSIEIAKSASRPQINANLNYNYTSDDLGNMFNSDHNLWNAGIKVGIPIFDGFSAKAKVDEAKARYEQITLEEEDLREQIALDIRNACLDLAESSAIIKSQKDSIEEAAEALKIAEISYNNGVATNLDVLDSQVSLSQIEKNLSEAIYDYVMAKAYLDKARGKQTIQFPKD